MTKTRVNCYAINQSELFQHVYCYAYFLLYHVCTLCQPEYGSFCYEMAFLLLSFKYLHGRESAKESRGENRVVPSSSRISLFDAFAAPWYAFHFNMTNFVGNSLAWRTDTTNQRGGGSEWEPIKIILEGDGDSNKTNTASNTRLQLTTQVGKAHVATGVPLDLGTNTQPSEPKHTNTQSGNLHGLLPVLHRSDRWTAPVRPVATAASQQAFQRTSVTSLGPGTKPPQNTTCTEGKPYTKPNKTTPNRPRTDQQHQDPKTRESSSSPEANPTSDSHRYDRSRAPVRPV
jgi:hypothetical protein